MKVEGREMEPSSNGFNFNHSPSPSSSSSSSSLTNSNNDLTIFPPINHEGLPLPPPHALRPHAPPLSFFNSDSDSPSSSPPRQPHFSHFAHLALAFCHSKLYSLFSFFRNYRGVFSVFSPVLVSVLVGLWFWACGVRHRRRRLSDGESVEHLKRVIKDKDEKIVQLLEQIAQLNKVLLDRHRRSVMRP